MAAALCIRLHPEKSLLTSCSGRSTTVADHVDPAAGSGVLLRLLVLLHPFHRALGIDCPFAVWHVRDDFAFELMV